MLRRRPRVALLHSRLGMAQEGTEPATARRLREARQRGRVPRSALLAPGVLVVACVLLLVLQGEELLEHAHGWLGASLTGAAHSADPGQALWRTLTGAALGVAPYLLAVVALAALADLAQLGAVWANRAPAGEPRPLLAGWVSGAQLALVAGAAFVWALDAALRVDWAALGPAGASLVGALTRFGASFALGLALVAAVDVVRARATHERSLRMTRHERLRERRQDEGPLEPRRARRRLWRSTGEGA